jgi:chromosome partitioning protein
VKKIAIVAQKGGVGKTTVAVNLAVSMQASGLKTILFDLDPQESAAMWADRRQDEFPHVEFLTERRLPEGFRSAVARGFSLAIIDTPPAAGPQAHTAAESADLVLIPCRPNSVDLDAIRQTSKLIKSAGVPAFVVFNAVPPGATTLLEDAKDIVEKEPCDACEKSGVKAGTSAAICEVCAGRGFVPGLVVGPKVLRERSAYRAAWPLGRGVVENEPYGKAAQEISELQDWVCAQLKVCTPDTVKAEREVAHG